MAATGYADDVEVDVEEFDLDDDGEGAPAASPAVAYDQAEDDSGPGG